MKLIKYFILIFFALWLNGSMVLPASAQTDREKTLTDISLWIDWKMTQSLNDSQRAVLQYLHDTAPINQSFESVWVKGGVGVDSLAKKLKAITVPPECAGYSAGLDKIVSVLRQYNTAYVSGKSLATAQMNNIKFNILSADGDIVAKFFELLRSVGLFETYESELRSLKKLS